VERIVVIDVRDASPIFDIVVGGHYVGLWFLAGRDQDFLALVFKPPNDPDLQLRYRFRYYKDDKIFFDETTDEKSTWNASLTNRTDDEAITIVDGMAEGMIAKGYLGSRLPWLVKKRYTRKITKCGSEAFMRVLMTLPFVHAKALPKAKASS
jgi:hypothetical protein